MQETPQFDQSQLDQLQMNQLESGSTSIDPYGVQSLLGTGGGSLIPEELVTLLIVTFVVLNILGLIFIIFYIASSVRKWKVQTAVLHMQKDIAEIKLALATTPRADTTRPVVKPAAQNDVITKSLDSSDDSRPGDSVA